MNNDLPGAPTRIIVKTTYEEYSRLRRMEESFKEQDLVEARFKSALANWVEHFEQHGVLYRRVDNNENYNPLKILIDCLGSNGIDFAFMAPHALKSFAALGYNV